MDGRSAADPVPAARIASWAHLAADLDALGDVPQQRPALAA